MVGGGYEENLECGKRKHGAECGARMMDRENDSGCLDITRRRSRLGRGTESMRLSHCAGNTQEGSFRMGKADWLRAE